MEEEYNNNNNNDNYKKVANRIKKFLKFVAKLLLRHIKIVLIVLGIIALIAAFMYLLNKLTGVRNDDDPGNVPSQAANYISNIKINDDGTLNVGKNAEELWKELVKNDSDIESYLSGPEALAKMMGAEVVTSFPDTREDVSKPIDWKKLNFATGDLQGIVKFRRGNKDGNVSYITYVDPTTYYGWIDDYNANGNQDSMNKAMTHFTVKAGKSSSNFSTPASGDAISQEECDEAVENAPVYSYEELFQLAQERYGMDEQAFIICLGWIAGEAHVEDNYWSYLCACCPINCFLKKGSSSLVSTYTSWGPYYAYGNFQNRANTAPDITKKFLYLALNNLDTRPDEANGMCIENGLSSSLSVSTAIYSNPNLTWHDRNPSWVGWGGIWSDGTDAVVDKKDTTKSKDVDKEKTSKKNKTKDSKSKNKKSEKRTTSGSIDGDPKFDDEIWTTKNPYEQGPTNWRGQCTWFAWARAYEIYGYDLGFRGNGSECVRQLMAAHSDKFTESKTPVPGAVFSWATNHVGIVISVEGDKIITQEGNIQSDGHGYPGIAWNYKWPQMGTTPYGWGTMTRTTSEMEANGVSYANPNDAPNIDGSSSSDSESGSSYSVVVAKWNRTENSLTTDDPQGEAAYHNVQATLSTETIDYQKLLTNYKLPFNMLWAFLVIGEQEDFVLAWADLVYNSDFEITIYDDYTKDTDVMVETYNRETQNRVTALVVEQTEGRSASVTFEETINEPHTKTRTSINETIVPKTVLTRANCWIVDYQNEYTAKKETTQSVNSVALPDEEMPGYSRTLLRNYNTNAPEIAAASAQVSQGVENPKVSVLISSVDSRTRRTGIVDNTTHTTETTEYIEGVPSLKEKTGYKSKVKKRKSDTVKVDSLDNFLFIGDSRYSSVAGQIAGLGSNINNQGVGSARIDEWVNVAKNGGTGTVQTTAVNITGSYKGISVQLGANSVLGANGASGAVSEMKSFLSKLKSLHPGTPIFVNSCLGVNSNATSSGYQWAPSTMRDSINKFNEGVQEYCNSTSDLYYIDISDGLMDGNGFVKLEYENDGLHCNAAGGQIFANNIKSGVLGQQANKKNTESSEEGFVSLFRKKKYETNKDNVMSVPEWLFEIIEENEDTADMLDLIKYLLYKATGVDFGVKSFDFSVFKPDELTDADSAGSMANAGWEFTCSWENSALWQYKHDKGASYASTPYINKYITQDKKQYIMEDDWGTGNGNRNYGFGVCFYTPSIGFMNTQYFTKRGINVQEAKYNQYGTSKIDVETVDSISQEIWKGVNDTVKKKAAAAGVKLEDYQLDALTDIAYQYGPGTNFSAVFQACRNGQGKSESAIRASHPGFSSWGARSNARLELFTKGTYTAGDGSKIDPKDYASSNGNIIEMCKKATEHYNKIGAQYSIMRPGEGPLIYGNIKACWDHKYICCATYVSVILYKTGALTESQINKYNYHSTSRGGYPDMLKAAGWKKYPISQAKPGDVLLAENYHVQIYAGDGKVWDETTCSCSHRQGPYKCGDLNRYVAYRPKNK